MLRDLGLQLAENEADFRTNQEAARAPAATSTTTVAAPEVPAYLGALRGIDARCRFLRSPGWFAEIVLAPLGPEPRVDLASYGTVLPLADTTPTEEDLGPFASSVVGRDLSAVEARLDGHGGVIARWSYAGATGRSGCEAIGSTDGSFGSNCGTLPFEAPAQHHNLVPGDVVVVVQYLDADVAFVVLDVGDESYVQRPAAGMALLRSELDGAYQVRLYDADGNQLACSPDFGTTFAPTC